ncbi:MAG: Hsp20/alpha crystallin family protein [Candidatus Aminicenantes bacterium]|jgi:HSP20 family protein
MVKRIKPVSRTIKIEAEINRIAKEVFVRKRDLLGLDESWVPCVDISERGNNLTIEVELPGVVKKDITILLFNSRIEIKGIKKENLPGSPLKFLRLEREYGTFRRFIFLPSAVIHEKAKASLENGILTINLKKYRPRRGKEVVLEIGKEDKTAEE